MPNFDGGHYFLTVLIPVRTDPVQDPRSTASVTSHAHALREALVALPTALQTPTTEQIGLNSPFARDGRTHFARFAVIDDAAYNGRDKRDPIRVALLGPDPVKADPVDHLPHPYLLFAADFDAASGDAAELTAYLRGLWSVMQPEWRSILQHCHGYDRVDGPDGFARLIMDCQVETTMPFNDYWTGGPQLTTMPIGPLLMPLAVAAGALLLGLVGALLAAAMGCSARYWLVLALLGLIAAPITAGIALWQISSRAREPFPMANRSDLPGVLKALYLQQAFTRFAIDQQGRDPAALHAAFGDFLRTHRPEDTAAPTQKRGVVRS
jgi:hypothetical protein